MSISTICTDFSVKDFVKKNCTNHYDLPGFTQLADDILNQTNGSISRNSALNMLSRYATIKNSAIVFNPDRRNPDQNYAELKTKMNDGLIKNDAVEKNSEAIKTNKSEKSLETNTIIAKPKSTGRGFGNLNQLKKIIEEPKQIVATKTDTIISTKTESNSLVNKREVNLFKSAKSESSSNEKSTLLKPKKGGFGIFNKSFIKDDFEPKIDSSKSTMTKSDKMFGPKQNIPTESVGIKRTDPLYGPYGTDNYHDDHHYDDIITDETNHRVDIYRVLESQYYPPQRSEEWFILRNGMITASDGGTIVKLNPYELEFGFIFKKIFERPFETSEACYHGKKFEYVATMIYEYRMNVKVREFGLCKHPKYNFLGASPDGIVSEYKLQTRTGKTWEEIDEEIELIKEWPDKRRFMEHHGVKTQFVGRMLEIKCPNRRKILMDPNAVEVYGPHGEKITDLLKDVKKGVCPAYYWVQVQLQLQCCELDECDFWQCDISEYADFNDFAADTDPSCPWLSKQTKQEKGALIQLLPVDQVDNELMSHNDKIYNFASFIYQPKINMSQNEIEEWISRILRNIPTSHPGMALERIIYWRTNVTRNITIKRDDQWFADNLETFRQMWDYVEYFRSNRSKADLIKRYVNKFPLDRFGKVKEPYDNKGIIMRTIQKICSNPTTDKDVRLYDKFISAIEKEITDANVPMLREYNYNDDIIYVNELINPKNEFSDAEKKDHINFIKYIKSSADNYLLKLNKKKEKECIAKNIKN